MPQRPASHRPTSALRTATEARPSAARRGYGHSWRKARLDFLRQHPLCAECFKEGRLTPATEADHVIPHKGDMVLFWDPNNLQALCASCHSRKTASEGAFGRPIKEREDKE